MNECYYLYCRGKVTLDKDYYPRNGIYPSVLLESPKCILCLADHLALEHTDSFPCFLVFYDTSV